MEALNVEAEYRKYTETQTTHPVPLPKDLWVSGQVLTSKWIEDDGDYYTREEWNSQYTTPIKDADPRYVPGVSEVDDDMTDAEWVEAFGAC